MRQFINKHAAALFAFASTFLYSTLALAQDAAESGGEGAQGSGWIDLSPDALWGYFVAARPYLIKAVSGLLFFWFGRIVIRRITRGIGKLMEKRGIDPTVARFATNLANYALLAGLVLGILGYFGVDTTSFAALIAAMGLAIGMALEGTLGNFASGVMLLVFKPFQVGDFVTAGGTTGTIEEIGIFTTTFVTLDNQKVIVPNGKIFGDTITNVGAKPKRRVDIDVGCDYSADIDETRKVLESMYEHIPDMIQEPAPQVFLKGLGGSSVDWQIRVWCETDDYWDVWQQTIRATKKVLDEAEIGIPFPQMDVHLDQVN